MWVGIITLFPDMFKALTDFGITGRACKSGLVNLHCWNPRDYTKDKHRTVDDRPYGGGPGMLMKTQPLQAAIAEAKVASANEEKVNGKAGGKVRVIYLSPQGRPLDQTGVVELASSVNKEPLILLCGRYEGIDERLIQAEVDEEWSVGDYVLSGGELAAMTLLDAIIRYQPGALGHAESAQQDSFVTGLLDCPHYTRPELCAGQKVPGVLLSGNHEDIRRWRLKQSLGRSWLRRPDLVGSLALNEEQKGLLEEFISENVVLHQN